MRKGRRQPTQDRSHQRAVDDRRFHRARDVDDQNDLPVERPPRAGFEDQSVWHELWRTIVEKAHRAQVVGNRRPTPPAALDDAGIQQVFGDALSALPPAPKSFTLYFQFDSDELTPDARALLPEILRIVKERPVPDVVAIGHTDTTGSAASNYQLGLRRAARVRDLLVEAGLDATLIAVTSAGEGELLIRTPDETPEPRNRRVEIAVR